MSINDFDPEYATDSATDAPELVLELFPTGDALTADVAVRFFQLVAAAQNRGDGIARVAFTGGTLGIGSLRAIALLAENPVEGLPVIDWSKIYVFFGDERNVPVTDPESNEGQARAALLDHVAIPDDHIFGYSVPQDVFAAAEAYAAVLADKAPDGFDLHFLGMGGEGHINSLFPHTAALAVQDSLTTGVVDSPKPPAERVTLTMPAIASAREVWFVVGGKEKAEAVNEVLVGGDPQQWPAAGVTAKDLVTMFAVDDVMAN